MEIYWELIKNYKRQKDKNSSNNIKLKIYYVIQIKKIIAKKG